MLPGLTRYMMPLWTSGMRLVRAAFSFIAQTHASRRSFTLARVISFERAVAPRLIFRRAISQSPAGGLRSISSVTGT